MRLPRPPRELAGDTPPVTIGGRRRPPLARGDAAHPTRVPAWALAPWLAEPVLNLAGHGQCDVVLTS
jgi:hypothetical protein